MIEAQMNSPCKAPKLNVCTQCTLLHRDETRWKVNLGDCVFGSFVFDDSDTVQGSAVRKEQLKVRLR